MSDKIHKYWEIMKPIVQISMILDPRQKLDLIESVTEKEHAKLELQKIFTKYKEKLELQPKETSLSSKTSTNPSQIVSKIKEKVLSLAQRSFADKNKMTVQESELTNYFSEPRIPIKKPIPINTVSDLRSRLHPTTIRCLMCLKSWFKLGID